MSIAAIEDPFHELQEECYICFEPCKTKSPCKCERFVHKKCLEDWTLKSNSDSCTECLEKYQLEHKRYRRLNIVALTVLLYIIFGILGQLSYDLFQQSRIQLSYPWSIEYFLSSLMMGGFFVFLYGMVKRYRAIGTR